MQDLAPGPLAELRRMKVDSASAVFWRLAARHPQTIGRNDKQQEWIAIIRILAILTETGDPSRRNPLHDPARRLGTVLCDGGDRETWPPKDGRKPQPMLSERRLIQLLVARGPQRAVLLERAARMLARSRLPGSGINVDDVAWSLLNPTDSRQLAEHYYGRLDRAQQAAESHERGTE